jgi:hypothetical protein
MNERAVQYSVEKRADEPVKGSQEVQEVQEVHNQTVQKCTALLQKLQGGQSSRLGEREEPGES